MRILLFYCFCLILLISYTANAESWRGITPLHSTRADVERLLGQPDRPGGNTYRIKSGRVNVYYSDGECSAPRDWDVLQDIVTSIDVNLVRGTLLFPDLVIDKSKFKSVKSFYEEVEYRNDKDGIVYTVDMGKYVDRINYIPSAKDSRLSCSARSRNLNLEDIQKIKPLYSTRRNVEKLLGKPVKTGGNFYILKKWSVEVTYSDGACKGADDWSVSKDVVTKLKIIPADLITYESLKVDKTKFKQDFSSNSTGFLYLNAEEGIVYQVNSGAEIPNPIGAIFLQPKAKDAVLRCSAKK